MDLVEGAMMNEINIQTECLELDQQVEFYKKKLTDKLFEQDNLILHVCRDIENSYLMEFGELEFKIRDYTLKNKKCEMEISKIRKIKPSRGFNIKLIESEVDEYFRKEDDELKYLKAKINLINLNKPKEEYEYDFPLFKQMKKELIEYKKSIYEDFGDEIIEKKLSPEEKEELDTIYKEFIYNIHPYFHEDLNDEAYDVFFTAKDYFKDNKLDEIKSLKDDYLNKINKKPVQKSDEELNRQINSLKNKINLVDEDIAEIKNKKPYTLKEIMDSPEKQDSLMQELELELEKIKEESEFLKSEKIASFPTRGINNNFQ